MNTGEEPPINKINHFHRYLEYAASVISKYNGTEPFHLYLKKYFAAHKKHGSRDRKVITSLCYDYFRLGSGVSSSIGMAEKFELAVFLVEKESSLLTGYLRPSWAEKINIDIREKIELVKNIFNVEDIFPFKDELSGQVNFKKLGLSFLIQPGLFVRARPGHEKAVTHKLKAANISFETENKNCLIFSNAKKVSDILTIDVEAVIQDYNSQRIAEFLTPCTAHRTSHISLWDCCAASGGKSILAYDTLQKVELTVSDTRKSILKNLHLRFAKAGIKNYHSFVADISIPLPGKIKGEPFDFIIADVPCSGSGTWSRTPGQLHFFHGKEIEDYSLLQRKIVSNAVAHLGKDGYFLYITCSVFKKENEENVNYIQENLNLELIKSEYLQGYEKQADTLFAALFRK